MPELELTREQQAVVNHDYGPALVFAVAGAGKTTALEHRIVRLVQERVFEPHHILAVAYNTAVKQELERRLMGYDGCGDVQVYTLHSLGLRAIRMARDAGLLPGLAADAFEQFSTAEDAVLNAALNEARKQNVQFRRELDSLDRKDFLTWLTAEKGNLRYPDMSTTPQPVWASGIASQAEQPQRNSWYLALYRLFEDVRKRLGLLTFDDQLVTGWETIVTYSSILQRLQRSFRCVMVDEYQDVNLAQADLLDRIVQPHRNYMVVGDDDQTIYEWRGARPDFILGFAKKYDATPYFMTENFRCKLGTVLLANNVIRHNTKRQKKSLKLTQGVDGDVVIEKCSDASSMGKSIAEVVLAKHHSGLKYREIAVLLRAYAQSAPVEQAFIARDVPYEIFNDKPFYLRREVQVFVDYCRLAYLEAKLVQGQSFSPQQYEQVVKYWRAIYWQPKRYISREQSDRILIEVDLLGSPLTEVLQTISLDASDSVRQSIKVLGATLRWLASAFSPGQEARTSAHSILVELNKRLGYTDYLEDRSEISEAGADEAETVRQFIEYARGRGNLDQFLRHVNGLEAERERDRARTSGDVVTIRSIHTAKGLEWPVVILPSCDDGRIPHRKSDNIEEERRLLYVAITRSKCDLFIYHLEKEPTNFLLQAKHSETLLEAKAIQSALRKPPEDWSVTDLLAMAIGLPERDLMSYLERWHPWPLDHKRAAARNIMAFYGILQSNGLHTRYQGVARVLGVWKTFAGDDFQPQDLRIQGLSAWIDKHTTRQIRSSRDNRTRRHNYVQSPEVRSVGRVDPNWRVGDSILHPIHGNGIVTELVWMDEGLTFLKARFTRDTKLVNVHVAGVENLSHKRK